MNSVLSAFLLTFAGLFPIVNPIEAAPFFLGLTAGMSSAERTVLARKAAVNGFALLLGSMVLGPWLLEFFGVELPVMRIAGGLVVTALGWKLLSQESSRGRPVAARANFITESTASAPELPKNVASSDSGSSPVSRSASIPASTE